MIGGIRDKDLALAYAAHAASAARNRLFSQKAKKDGRGRLADVLAAVADAEDVQARRALIYLRGKIDDLAAYTADLKRAKRQGAATEFPALQQAAAGRDETHVAENYERYAAVAQNHGELLDAAETDGSSDLYVCQVCGFIASDAVPDHCPVCNAVSKKFKRVPA